MDVLSQVLRTARIQEAGFRRLEVGAPWAVQVVPWEHPLLYAVLVGTCVVDVDGQGPVRLAANDLVVIGQGRAHTFADRPSSRPLPFPELLGSNPYRSDGTLCIGGPGQVCVMLVSELRFERPDSDALLRGLPSMLTGRGEPGDARTARTVALIAEEITTGGVGNDAVLARLSDVLFIQAVRGHLGAAPNDQTGWLAALSDAQLAPVIAAVHAAPHEPWTVDRMADAAALSRSAYAERFTRVLGEPPMRYLTRVRMHRAAQLLRGDGLGIREVAMRVGYETEASFSKAFHRWFSIRPGAYRQAMLDAEELSVRAVATA